MREVDPELRRRHGRRYLQTPGPSERVAGDSDAVGGPAVSSDLVDIFLLGLVSTFNPSLLAAVTVMLLLPNPKRLMSATCSVPTRPASRSGC